MISRRKMMQLAAVTAASSLFPLRLFGSRVTPVMKSNAMPLDLHADTPLSNLNPEKVVQELDVFLKLDVFLTERPSSRELQVFYSGRSVWNTEDYVRGRNVIEDKIGDIILKHGGDPDWLMTGNLRYIYYQAEMPQFEFENPPFSHFYNDQEFWPIPIIASKCGFVFWMQSHDWIVNHIIVAGGVRSVQRTTYLKYQFGPPEDASLVEKIGYGTYIYERYDVALVTYEEHIPGCRIRKPIGWGSLNTRRLMEMEEHGVDMVALNAWIRSPAHNMETFFASQIGGYLIRPSSWAVEQGVA